jgi:two-component system, LytTR family, sensor kinase
MKQLLEAHPSQKFKQLNTKTNFFIYWAFYLLLFTFMQVGQGSYLQSFGIEIIVLPFKMAFVFLVTHFMMKKYLFRQKLSKFLSVYLLSLLGFAFLHRLLENHVILEYFLTSWSKESIFSSFPLFLNIIKIQFAVAIPFAITLIDHWSMEQKKRSIIEKEKMEAELSFLRNQFHPHFIFNILNSLYSKILSNSPESADIVIKISSLLRYTIYDINTSIISIEKEVNYLKDYISLQKLRFDKRLELSFITNGDLKTKKIEPYLLIPLVENSFKHCSAEGDEICWITINISVLDDYLTLKIENSTSSEEGKEKQDSNSSGVGLENVRRRLDLLYPNEHSLKATKNEGSFFVSLKIKLK